MPFASPVQPGAPGVPSSAGGLIRAAGRDTDVVAFETTLVSFFLDAADMLGVPKSVAAIYAICFASAEPLSFADIEERLDISRGSISQGLRVLRDTGALKVVAGPSDRREFFTPDLSLRNLIDRWIEKRLKTQLEAGRGRLQAVGKAVSGRNPAANKILRARVKTLQSWNDKARALMPIVRTFLKLR